MRERSIAGVSKTGASCCANKNFCGGKSIPKRDRSKENSGSRFIERQDKNISREKETEGSGDSGVLYTQVMSRELGERDALVDEVHDVLGGSTGEEDFGDAGLLQDRDVRLRDNAAD